MSTEKIYAVKAKKKGGNFSGRFKALNMSDATKQATDYLSQWGSDWNIQISELKNQTLAMKQFNS